ncbi:hypothetical protein HYPSUDRAFT_638281 [Hypholoma sublateritium FD-334 SS-4]|uniref:Uncharacterized protein n=1 Tax=Hypholoma sublateritium (strain FD-334 SS-4) TaxID=945553 RepID=A0A0D2L6Y5_HYPSF|nr:hypothetical protein HYPSUDRAFT_638281 [Hypholoma sublateritium FD-334 SS-4]
MGQDIVANAANDYRYLKSGLNVPLCAYFASRIRVLGYLLGSVVYTNKLFEYRSRLAKRTFLRNGIPAAPTGNCLLVNVIVALFCVMAFSCTALLFFLRLRAIYNRNHVVVAIFFIF